MLRKAHPQLCHTNLKKIGIVTSPSPWATVNVMHNGTVETFRKEAFAPSIPATLPKSHYQDFPAIWRWFLMSKDDPNTVALNHEYLNQFGNAIVAQEYSWLPESSQDTAAIGSFFSRQELPFCNFLRWATDLGTKTKFRIYVAQTSVSALPSKMRDDLPVPNIVTQAGRGDIYDASIWIGISPTYTPLHHDPNPNILVQLAGHKIVRLLPPDAGSDLFAEVQKLRGTGSSKFMGEEMMMGEEGCLFNDLIWHDKFNINKSSLSGFEARLAQGDGLFIPKGWWHSVRGVGEGITASVSS